jgi:hypothetical protein
MNTYLIFLFDHVINMGKKHPGDHLSSCLRIRNIFTVLLK